MQMSLRTRCSPPLILPLAALLAHDRVRVSRDSRDGFASGARRPQMQEVRRCADKDAPRRRVMAHGGGGGRQRTKMRFALPRQHQRLPSTSRAARGKMRGAARRAVMHKSAAAMRAARMS